MPRKLKRRYRSDSNSKSDSESGDDEIRRQPRKVRYTRDEDERDIMPSAD